MWQHNVPFLTEDSDLWDYPPRTKKRRKRIRRLTLARAIIEARKAGVFQGRVTVDGVTLEFGSSVPTENDANPWDEVLSHATH